MNDTATFPASDLRSLERLIGTWEITGDAEGTVRYEWMEGGAFLVQRVDMTLYDHAVKATEIIGHLRPFGEEPSVDIHSRSYDSDGNTFDYVYELAGDILTIWAGEKGSPTYFRGAFSDDDTNTGEWVYPEGGYRTTMTRRPEVSTS